MPYTPDPYEIAPDADQGIEGGEQATRQGSDSVMTIDTTTDTNQDEPTPQFALGGVVHIDGDTWATVRLVDNDGLRITFDDDGETRHYAMDFDDARQLGSLLVDLARIVRPQGLARPAIGFYEFPESER